MAVEHDARDRPAMPGSSALRPSRLPLYLQVSEVLRQRLDGGTWRPGTLLPTLTDLAAEFSVAKVTVRQAVRILEEEGLLRAQRGKGTTVLPRSAPIRRLNVETQLSSLVDMYRGDRPELGLLEDRVADLPPAPFAGDPSPEGYHLLRRTHSRDGCTYCVISIHIVRPIFARHEARLRRELALPVLHGARDVVIGRARQMLQVGKCDYDSAGLLDLTVGDPVAHVRRILCGVDDRILYLADVTYRGDFVQLEMDLLA